MTSKRLISATLLSGLFMSPSAVATDPDYPRIPREAMPDRMPMYDMPPRGMSMPRFNQPPPTSFSDFPTAAELASMMPSEPVTEEQIKQRFSARKEKLKKMLDQDRKAAVEYAQDFSRYQKQQSDNLVKLMARAEKRRTAIFKRLEEQEKRVLEQFRQRNQAPEEEPEKAEPSSQSSQ